MKTIDILARLDAIELKKTTSKDSVYEMQVGIKIINVFIITKYDVAAKQPSVLIMMMMKHTDLS